MVVAKWKPALARTGVQPYAATEHALVRKLAVVIGTGHVRLRNLSNNKNVPSPFGKGEGSCEAAGEGFFYTSKYR
jgi:hypothetical protein